MKFRTDVVREIWRDETGDCLEVRPDTDGMRCVEVRYSGGPLTMPPDQARLVAEAILACAAEIAAGEVEK